MKKRSRLRQEEETSLVPGSRRFVPPSMSPIPRGLVGFSLRAKVTGDFLPFTQTSHPCSNLFASV